MLCYVTTWEHLDKELQCLLPWVALEWRYFLYYQRMVLMSHGIRGGYGWWRKRIIAVAIPYAIVQCFLYWTCHKFNIGKFLLDIFCIKPLYMNGWYLSYLVLWYILFYIINKITFLKQRKVKVFFLLSIILFIIYSIVLNDSLRAEQSFSFLVGIILSEKKKILIDNDTKKVFLNLKTMTLFFIISIAFLGLKQIPSIHGNKTFVFDIIQILIKLFAGLGIMELTWFLSKKINMRIFEYIGLFGFELYIIHGYILEKVPLTLKGANFFVVIAFGSAIIYHLFVKKISRYMKMVILKRNI